MTQLICNHCRKDYTPQPILKEWTRMLNKEELMEFLMEYDSTCDVCLKEVVSKIENNIFKNE